MENQNGFDLNVAMAKWRAALAGQESIGPDEARELEGHLRDGIAAWMEKGLTAEEAFEIETRRLGKAASLAREFQAEDALAAWRNRLYWVVIGLLMMSLLMQVTKAGVACASYLLAWGWCSEEFASGAGTDVVTSMAGLRDWEIMNFLEAPTQLPLWAALMTPLVLYCGSRWRALAAKNPRSDLYWLTRTRARTALTFAVVVTLAHLVEVGAHWYGQQFFGLSGGSGLRTEDVGLGISYAWALALLAIGAARMRTPAGGRQAAASANS